MRMNVLLIDTCGERAGVACVCGDARAQVMLEPRAASAEIVAASERVLAEAGCAWDALEAVGVVSGPGAFTGVRVGLAAAKGFCEARGLKFAAVSRLAVLLRAADVSDGCAALYAGRGELYVRDAVSGREWLATAEDVIAAGKSVVAAEERVMEMFVLVTPRFVELSPLDAYALVMERLAAGGDDVAAADANYVRGEADIYKKPGAAAC